MLERAIATSVEVAVVCKTKSYFVPHTQAADHPHRHTTVRSWWV